MTKKRWNIHLNIRFQIDLTTLKSSGFVEPCISGFACHTLILPFNLIQIHQFFRPIKDIL